MSTTIEPTIGRIVWYRGKDGETRPAIVVGVNGTFNLDLYVFGQNSEDNIYGHMGHVTHADPEQEPGCLSSWHWMPYQKDQAKNAEERAHQAKQLAVSADRAIESSGLRAHAIEMALRTPGLAGHNTVLATAAAYQAYIAGIPPASVETKTYADGTTFTGTAPLPDHSPTSIGGGLSSTAGLSFGTALCALKSGKRVARAGWNGKGLFVYLVPAASYPAQTGAAKAFYGEGGLVPYTAYMAVKNVDDTVSTWAPSGSDALAEDWLIVE